MQKNSILLVLVFSLLINIPTALCSSPTAPIVYVDTDGSGDYNCDGTDDHVQINQALAFVGANAAYTTVHLNGSNTYWIDLTLNMHENSIFQGDSDAEIKLVADAAWAAYVPMISNTTAGSTNFTIRNFIIDGNSENKAESRGQGYYNMMYFLNCNHITVDNMRLEWSLGDGLKVSATRGYVGDPAYVTFTNNSVYKLGHDGLYAIRINNVTAAHNDVFTRTNSAIRLTDSGNATVYNNTIQSSYLVDGSTGPGMELDSNTGYIVDSIEIYNNTFHTLEGSGIWLTNEDTDDIIRTSNIHIHHNTFYDVGQRVVDSGRTMAAITVGQFDDVLIENNVIDDGGRAGIKAFVDPVEYTMDASFTITVRNNIIVNTDGTPGAGIWNFNDITHTIISENNCIYNNTEVYNGTNITATDDIFDDPLLVDVTNHDYHLKSNTETWNEGTSSWDIHTVDSPCIDAGHPTSDYSNEPEPNGDRINIGRYGNTAEASMSVSDLPTASAGSDQTVTAGDTVTLDGSASTDDVGIESHVWDFDDSNGLQQDASGAVVQHTYNTAGTYTVTLTVTDTDGNTDNNAVIITVTEVDHEPIVNDKLDIEYGTVTIDGDLSDWDDTAGIIIQEPTGRDMEERNTAVVKGQYDDTYLYMSFDVTDTNLLATALDENGSIYYDDSVEIFIDTLNNNGVAMETDDYHFMINLNGAVRDYKGTGSGKDISYTGNLLKGITLMGSNSDASDTDTGYIIEIAIPWDDIGGLPTGDIVGLDITIDDRDSDNVDEVQHYDWCNLISYAIPDEWNDGVLKPEVNHMGETTTISIVPSSQTVAPGETFTADVSIDPVVPITGAQFDLTFESSSVSIDGVAEGDLFRQAGTTLFNAGTIDNSAGEVSDVFVTILGEAYVFGEGVMATVNLTADSATGYTQLDLSDVIISDPDSNSVAVNTSNVTILVDTAPVLSSISDQSVIEESVLGFTVSGSDIDGDSLIYSATDLPNGTSFDTFTGEFSWTPADNQAGTYSVTFEVTDGYLSDSATTAITVIPLNHAPEISELVPSDGSTFDETESISIEVSAFDEDGDALSYTIKIDGVKCSTSSSYVWNTDYSSAGAHTIEVIVSDGIESIPVQHSIIINDVHPLWDVNEDGKVNILDITLIGQQYGNTVSTPYPRWDVNQDSVINIQDLTITSYHFGETVE